VQQHSRYITQGEALDSRLYCSTWIIVLRAVSAYLLTNAFAPWQLSLSRRTLAYY